MSKRVSVRSRTYALSHHATEAKLDQVSDILPLWKSCMASVQYIQVKKIREGKPIGWLTAAELESFKLPLSARMIKSVVNQVNGSLRSWESKTKKLFRAELKRSSFSGEDIEELHELNNTGKWFTDPRSAHIMEAVLKVNTFPVFRNVRTMVFDSLVCESQESKTDQFDRWLKISTLPKGNPILIPITESDYYTSRSGEEAGVTQIRVGEDSSVKFSRVKQSPVAQLRSGDGNVVALDWGLVSLFTTNDGRRLGTQVYARLKKWDEQLEALTKALQRNNIKPCDSKRYRKLNASIREYVRNEVNRILNKLAAEGVDELVVESLDFRGGGLSRRLNRILSRSGRAAVRQKLAALTEDYGVIVTEVNPAHTSRECSGCGFADKLNRRTQKKFRCVFCGKTCNADHNAANTLEARRSRFTDGLRYRDRNAVLSVIDSLFSQRWRIEAAEIRQRHKRGHSTASTASL